jgi:hypothetical protein
MTFGRGALLWLLGPVLLLLALFWRVSCKRREPVKDTCVRRLVRRMDQGLPSAVLKAHANEARIVRL